MTKTRRTFPESLKREAVEQALAGTPLRHVAQAFDRRPRRPPDVPPISVALSFRVQG